MVSENSQFFRPTAKGRIAFSAKLLEISTSPYSRNAERYYKDVPRQHLPLSQQKEFRAIKNLVIQEAENLLRNIFTFEDADIAEEYTDVLPANSNYEAVLDYYQAVEILDADDATQAEKREALQTLGRLWDNGLAMAAYHLGRAWRNGLGVLPDDQKLRFGSANPLKLGSFALNMPWERSYRSRDE